MTDISITDLGARVALDAEVLTCADTGRRELILNNEEVTPHELRTRINDARYRLARMEELADAYERQQADASPCFPWCRDGHTADAHESEPEWLAIPGEIINPLRNEPLKLLEAVLYHSEDYGAGISIHPAGGADGATLHGDEIDQTADSLIAFAARIRRMGRLAEAADKARAEETDR